MSPPPSDSEGQAGAGYLSSQIREAIESKIPGAQAEVLSSQAGHFEIRVTSDAFADKNRIQQNQLVYGAITHLMTGPDAPVHAIDRMECVVP